MNKNPDLDTIRQMRLEGFSLKEISRAVGSSRTTVQRYLHKMGLTGKNRPRIILRDDTDGWRQAMPWL